MLRACIALWFIGCGGGNGGEEGEAEAEAEAEAEGEADGGTCTEMSAVVQFDTDDDVTLEADLRAIDAADAPAAVLLHMIPPSNDRTNYPTEFVDALFALGITVLNVDRRGAGGSEGVAADAYLGASGVLDAKAAIDHLATLACPPDPSRIALVGASNGTTTALDYAVLSDPVAPAALVFLTGGAYTENNNSIDANRTVLEAVPILFEYADNEAVWSGQFIAGAPTGWTFDERAVAPANGHGTNMFDADPASVGFVAGFLDDTL